MKINWKKLLRFTTDNYFISIFIAIILFVGFVSIFKLFFSKPTYVYARVKVGQGLWWASTQRPSIWFVKAIKEHETQKDLLGQPSAQILEVRYYPYYASSQFDIYVTLKLKVTGNKKTGEYLFNRSTIGIGSPIDLEFPTTQFSGTIIALGDKPIKDTYVEKTVTMTKKYAYPWEYDAIKVGDSYFDGVDTVFTVIDKQANDTNQITTTESFGSGVTNSALSEPRKFITVVAKMKLKQEGGQLVYGEEQNVSLGRNIGPATPNFTFNDFIVASIE